jgi:hypothetical protein
LNLKPGNGSIPAWTLTFEVRSCTPQSYGSPSCVVQIYAKQTFRKADSNEPDGLSGEP